jgi:hypothetical protein
MFEKLFGATRFDPLSSDAAEPVPGPTLGMGDGQDAHFAFPDEEDERVRKRASKARRLSKLASTS